MSLPESSNTLSVDCDGVIADKNHGGDYSKAGPLHYGIEQVNKLYDKGYTIILYIDDKAARVDGDHQDGWDQVWQEIDNLQGKDRYGNLK